MLETRSRMRGISMNVVSRHVEADRDEKTNLVDERPHRSGIFPSA